MAKAKVRCFWCGDDPLYVAYHDKEWGVPVHDDRLHFEQLILEGAQAGLSWLTILRKREHYRQAFAQFDPRKVVRFNSAKIATLMQNAGLVRHRGKLLAAVGNAQAFLKIQAEFGSYDQWLWAEAAKFPRKHAIMATTSPLAEHLSKELRKRGMKFVGPSIMHATLQAIGVYQDHLKGCWRRKGRSGQRSQR